MKSRELKPRTGIIHALDVVELEKCIKIAQQVEPFVDAIKLSWPFILKNGGEGMLAVRDRIELPIVACFKVVDIPEVSRDIVKLAIQYGANGITLQGFVGTDTMKECIELAHRLSAQTFMVTEMSHPGAVEFIQPVGEKLAKMAKQLGSDGIVAPATRPENITRYRKIVGNEILIMSPGVGPQGGQLGDALQAGANFEVIGRRIYLASDPAKEAEQYANVLSKIIEKKQPLLEA